MMSATLTFSVGCVGSANVTVYYQECANCQCLQDTSFSTNKQSISIASTPVKIVYSNLRPGATYCYRSEVVNTGIIVGFENGRMFTTIPPVPPTFLPMENARLVNNNTLLYECVEVAMGFDGGSTEIVAVFDSITGRYTVPVCKRERNMCYLSCSTLSPLQYLAG